MTYLRLLVGWSALILISTTNASINAGPILPGLWYEFGFDPNHSPVAAGCQPAPAGVPCRAGVGVINLDSPPWTFTASTPLVFTITDGLLGGDFFDVFDLGTFVGSTPSVPLSQHSCGLDPLVCLLDPQLSHASFLLPVGDHSITIFVHEAQILGEGFFEFTNVPEPSSDLMIVVGLLCICIWKGKPQHVI